jgi:nucleotide-binding universal stress UspA family protein
MDPQPLIDELHFRRVLVAIDGSPSSELALAAAVTVARRDNAMLSLICVAPDVVAETSRWPFTTLPPADQTSADRFADELLREAIDRIPEDILVRRVVKRGRPGPAIVMEARTSNTDAILMGARGVGRIGALLGSVSQHVMHHAEVPVFVAHAPREVDAAVEAEDAAAAE